MSALNYSVLLALSLCSLTAARFDDKRAKTKNIFPNNGVAAVLFSADLPKGHCDINLNGDLSAQYSGSASNDDPNAQVDSFVPQIETPPVQLLQEICHDPSSARRRSISLYPSATFPQRRTRRSAYRIDPASVPGGGRWGRKR